MFISVPFIVCVQFLSFKNLENKKRFAYHFMMTLKYALISGKLAKKQCLVRKTCPEVVKIFSCSTQLSMKFKLLIST